MPACPSSWSLIVADTFSSVLLPSFLPHNNHSKKTLFSFIHQPAFSSSTQEGGFVAGQLWKLGHPIQIPHVLPTAAVALTVSLLLQNHPEILPIISKFPLAYVLCCQWLLSGRVTSLVHSSLFGIHELLTTSYSKINHFFQYYCSYLCSVFPTLSVSAWPYCHVLIQCTVRQFIHQSLKNRDEEWGHVSMLGEVTL